VTKALTLVTLALVSLVITFLGWLLLVFPSAPGPSRGATVEVALSEFEDADAVIAYLAEAGIVEHPSLFAAYLRLLGGESRLRRGRVQIGDSMTAEELARTLAAGFGDGQTRITFPEGYTRYDFADRLADYHVCSEEEFLAATEDPEVLERVGIAAPTAEGYLFPDTYEIRMDTDAEEVVRLMVRTYRRRVLPVLEEHGAELAALERELAWGVHDVITMAAIVEKEAAVADERPRIAGVFLNRLRSEEFRPHRLQADPTVSYGCRLAPEISEPCRAYEGGAPSAAMVRDPENIYNTYLHEGLPPGPIASPGLASILAVLEAEEHDYFFFVARGGGRHQFSRTLEEHDAAVDEHLR